MARGRWNARFASWATSVSVSGVVTGLAEKGRPVTAKAVYHWLNGVRTPRLETAVAIQDLSHGQVRVEDLVGSRTS